MTTDQERLVSIANHYKLCGKKKSTMETMGCSFETLSRAIELYAKSVAARGPGRPRHDIPMLGTVSDHEVARRLGKTQGFVTRARQLRGIPPFKEDVPDGAPKLGSDLSSYRKRCELSLEALAVRLTKSDGKTYSKQALSHVEGRSKDLPISRALAEAFILAIKEGRLPPLEKEVAPLVVRRRRRGEKE